AEGHAQAWRAMRSSRSCSPGRRVPGRNGPLAHAWLEQWTHNPLVPSSTLGGPTRISFSISALSPAAGGNGLRRADTGIGAAGTPTGKRPPCGPFSVAAARQRPPPDVTHHGGTAQMGRNRAVV